jgi:hypothetical protein
VPAYPIPKPARAILADYAAMPASRRKRLVRRGRIVAGQIVNPCRGQTTATAHLFPLWKAAVEKLWPGVPSFDIDFRIRTLVLRATLRDPKASLAVRHKLTPEQQAIDIEVQAATYVAVIEAAGLDIAPDVREWLTGPWAKATRKRGQ